MVKEEDILNLSETIKEIQKTLLSNEQDAKFYKFFKTEIKPQLAYIDNSPTQTKADEPKRKYVGGYWNIISSKNVQKPWIRIGISEEVVPSLELIVSEDEQIPKIDLEVDALGGIGYTFKMGVEYSYRPKLLIEAIIKSVTTNEYRELLNIAKKFHKRLEPYL
ncbi:MAG: hypothetical protein QXD43_00780 [Candidatus Aenigmatarchaeota archaeon]